jgi:hypothetical protein
MLMKECNSIFKQYIRIKCYDALESSGFTRYRKEGVDWPLYGGFHGWVGLNTGLYSDRLCVEPFVGIHVVQLDRFWTNIQIGKYPGKYSRSVATYAIHISEIRDVEDKVEFVFSPQQNEEFIDTEVERLTMLYKTAGMDYARSIANYDVLLPLLHERVPMKGGYPQRVASCLYLMGRKDEARQFVIDYLPGNENSFGGFSEPFFAMLDREMLAKLDG